MRICLFLIVSLVCFASTGCGGYSLKVVIPQAVIQKSVDAYFPMSTKDDDEWEAPVDVTLSKAKVLLEDGSNQIGFEIGVEVELPDAKQVIPDSRLPTPPGPLAPPKIGAKTIQGSVEVFVGLRYDSPDAKFYCTDPKIKKLVFDDLPAEFLEPLRRATEGLLSEYLAKNSVYTLTDDQTSTSATKAVLKSISVENGTVYAEIGS